MTSEQLSKPLWFAVAEREIGVHETPGKASTQRIVEYHASTSLKATSDEVPWCASFVGWCLLKAGVISTGSAAAKSYLSWGVSCGPTLGAVVVIRKRTAGADKATGSSSGYHVAFFVGRSDSYISLLGGNQGDSVKVSNFPLSQYQVVDYRMPLKTLPQAA